MKRAAAFELQPFFISIESLRKLGRRIGPEGRGRRIGPYGPGDLKLAHRTNSPTEPIRLQN